MTEFETQVAQALASAMDWIAATELRVERGAPVPITPMAARLAPRVAAAVDALVEEYNDLLDEYGGSKMVESGVQVHDGADARRELQAAALAALRRTMAAP